jgi:phospholipase C
MLGFMKETNSDIDGCLPDNPICFNPIDPLDSSSQAVFVDNTAVYQQSDPSHSISGTTSQVYSQSNTTEDMHGFIASYSSRTGDASKGPTIMKCFSADHVPAISTLASEFAMFDGNMSMLAEGLSLISQYHFLGYFASVPGPTQVNRAYAASSTSNGMGTNDVNKMIRGFPQKTMFKQLEEMGLDYRVYFELIPSVLEFKDMRRKEARASYRVLKTLFSDLAAGDLPQYSWVEPRYYDTPNGKSLILIRVCNYGS